MAFGVRPQVTTDYNKLESQAKEKMSEIAYSYVGGGAGERSTMDANRLAFRQWKLIPRMLVPTTYRDMTVSLFGQKYQSPVLCAPVGVQKLFHSHGETGVAEVMASIDVPYIASTASSQTIEEIAAANDKGAGGKAGQRWYQLYWPHTEKITESLLSRAKSLGYSVLVVTLDTWAMSWRPWDLDNAFVPFFVGNGNATGFADPAFRERFSHMSGGKPPEDDMVAASHAWIADVFAGKAHTWDQLAHLRHHWEGPIILKGIQHPHDAVEAHARGMDGVICSNHGGRQLDGAIGSLEVLPEIVEAVKGKKTKRDPNESFVVLFDSGVRTGVDVIKAIALGAKAVLIGRPWVYGLGINGKFGARDVVRGILADVDQSMGLAGIQNLSDCTRDKLRRVEYGADRHSSN
ncbi:MAG: hypothetical protein Q9159_002682 [Coniocarpon cinnabarinum]